MFAPVLGHRGRDDPLARVQVQVGPGHQRGLGATLPQQKQQLEVGPERRACALGRSPEDRDLKIAQRPPGLLDPFRPGPPLPAPSGKRAGSDQPFVHGPAEEHRDLASQILRRAEPAAVFDLGDARDQRGTVKLGQVDIAERTQQLSTQEAHGFLALHDPTAR